MRILITALCLALPSGAMADACHDEIKALFVGPLDPFQRPPHRQITKVFDAQGNEIREMLSIVETPMRTIAGQPSANWFTMSIDDKVWNGPSVKGPWTDTGALMPADRDMAMQRTNIELAENLTETQCHGPDETGLIGYTYRSVTDPDANGGYFGSLDRIKLDPERNQIVEFDRTDFISSWAPDVSKERWLITVEFDPLITVSPP